MKKLVVLGYIRLDTIMVVTYCKLERENCKFFEISYEYFSWF